MCPHNFLEDPFGSEECSHNIRLFTLGRLRSPFYLLFWWTRGELHPCPAAVYELLLRVFSVPRAVLKAFYTFRPHVLRPPGCDVVGHNSARGSPSLSRCLRFCFWVLRGPNNLTPLVRKTERLPNYRWRLCFACWIYETCWRSLDTLQNAFNLRRIWYGPFGEPVSRFGVKSLTTHLTSSRGL